MSETPKLQNVVFAAEQAASAGDYTSAEHLLREAVLLQEASLGPSHPDLANTLNNLGVMCEATNKSADAGVCYRRAYAIVTAALGPDHPFVATSRNNLRDFCEAQGKPFELPVAPQVPTEEEKPQRADSETSVGAPSSTTTAKPLPPERLSRSAAIAVIGTFGLVLVMLAAREWWFGPNREPAISGGTVQAPVTRAGVPKPVRQTPASKPSQRNAVGGAGRGGGRRRLNVDAD